MPNQVAVYVKTVVYVVQDLKMLKTVDWYQKFSTNFETCALRFTGKSLRNLNMLRN